MYKRQSWFSVEDFCRKMGYDRTNLQRKLDIRQLAAMFGKNMQPEYVCTDTSGQSISHPIETVFEASLYKLGLENLCYPAIGEDGRTSYNLSLIHISTAERSRQEGTTLRPSLCS